MPSVSDVGHEVNFPRRWTSRIGLVFWLLAPMVALGILTAFASAQTLNGAKTEVWVPVEASEAEVTTQIDIALIWSAEPALVAPNWGGIVQAIHVKPGSVVEDGSRIARIDGIDRIAIRSDEPFYRPISHGDRGPDVEALNSYLARAGLPNSPSALASWSTLEGVRKLGESIGVRAARQFDPGWVVYLGSDAITARAVELQVGAPAPTLGTAILTSTRSLVGATTVARGSLDRFVNSGPGSTASSPAELSSLDIDQRAIEVPSDLELKVGSQLVGLDETRSAVVAESLGFLAGTADPNTVVIQANLSRMPGPLDVVIPTGTIFANESGTTCVRRFRTESAQNVRVEVVADLNGRAIVRGDLAVGDRVQVGVSGQARTCG